MHEWTKARSETDECENTADAEIPVFIQILQKQNTAECT